MPSRSKRDRTARLLKVAHILHQHPHGIRAREVARLCGVCVRTTYRDLGALDETLGYPVWEDGGLYGLEKGVFLPPLKLTFLEAMSLFLAARLVSRYSDERDENIQSAFGKLAAVMPEPVGHHVTHTVAAMMDRPDNPHHARVFDVLSTAWATGRRVRIWYPWTKGGSTEVYERLVEPYFLEPSPIGHACYLIAYCHHVGAVRTFKLERIRAVELTEQPYSIPAEFDADAYLKSSWGIVADEEVEVRLRFSPVVASRVGECRWHPSQTIRPLDDGGVEFGVRVAGTLEITPWILSWGAEVEVLAPEPLRAKVAETARRMGAIYGVGA